MRQRSEAGHGSLERPADRVCPTAGLVQQVQLARQAEDPAGRQGKGGLSLRRQQRARETGAVVFAHQERT